LEKEKDVLLSRSLAESTLITADILQTSPDGIDLACSQDTAPAEFALAVPAFAVAGVRGHEHAAVCIVVLGAQRVGPLVGGRHGVLVLVVGWAWDHASAVGGGAGGGEEGDEEAGDAHVDENDDGSEADDDDDEEEEDGF
jgi:hypothetical protein